MSLSRNALLLLALTAASPLPWPGSGVAAAQTPGALPEGIAGLPAPRAVLGGPAVDVWFAVWDAGGAPVTGLVGKATASVGAADAVVDAGGGLYRVSFRPPDTGSAKEAVITLKGKHPVSKRPVEASIPVAIANVAPVLAGAAPQKLVLGRDPGAAITAYGLSRAGVAWRASTGSVADSTALPSDVWTARYVAPTDRPPRPAVVAFADMADPLGRAGHVVLPLSGAIDFPVKGAPGASVLLEVGPDRFGPVVLDGAGTGKVPIVVPPGASSATKITVKDGSETREALDLKIPEARRLVLYPVPSTIPADGRTVSIRAAVVKPDGAPDPDAKPTFTTSAGSVSGVKGLGDGVFEAKWTLPTSGSVAKLAVSLGSATQTDEADVTLGAALPAAVAVKASPESVSAGAEVAVTVSATGLDGKAFGSGEPGLDLDGLKLVDSRREGDAWVYRATATAEGPVRATAWWKTPRSPNPAAGLGLVPERGAMANDGAAKIEVHVRAVDAFGAPVGGRKVALSVEGAGGARVEPAEVTTDDDGLATVTVVSGTAPGWVGLRARSQDLEQVLVVGQFPDGKAPSALPPPADPRIAATLPTARLSRGEAAPASPVQTVNLSIGGVAAAGGTVELVASSADAAGKPLPAFVPVVTTSLGTLSAPAARPDGTVSVMLTLPPDAKGPVELTATAGGRTARATVLGDDAAASVWGPEPQPVAPAPAPAPAPEVVPPAPRPERVPSTFRWLRVRGDGVGGTYRYAQSPSTEPGPVLPATLAVGGASGGAPATPVGGEGDVRVWLDPVGVPYLGFHGQLRGAAYSIASTAFTNEAKDTLWNANLDVTGRVPFDLSGDRYWIGAKAGFGYSDFLTFLGDLEPGSTIQFVGLGVPALSIGPELGAEVGPVYLLAGYAVGLASGTAPYSNQVDFEAGWEPVDHFFLTTGITTVVRNAVLSGADSGLDRGAIDDAALQFKLGVGLAL